MPAFARTLALVALTLSFGAGTVADAASSCRDAKGKFVKCASLAPKKCRDANGKFTKCTG